MDFTRKTIGRRNLQPEPLDDFRQKEDPPDNLPEADSTGCGDPAVSEDFKLAEI